MPRAQCHVPPGLNTLGSLVGAVLALANEGCGSAATFGVDLNRYTCERQYECAQGAFDKVYGDVGECRAELDEINGPIFACEVRSCEYDASRARECLHDVQSADCEEVVDGSAWAHCGDVFVACDETALRACIGAY
ncbi:MAG: hypothetical protein EXR69_03335 [Myxococcales bacterium]|nr:hypothetical protein [Myxococcales bacterium]